MKCAFRTLGTLTGLLLMAAAGPAQAPRPEEPLTRWAFVQELELPGGVKGPRCDFLLTPKVFDGARPEQTDLRLFDASGRELPYARRVRRARNEVNPLESRDFNRVTHPDRSVEVSIDLGEFVRDHNRVEIDTGGTNYRRPLRLEGSDDAKEWKPILDKYPVTSFRQDERVFDGRQVGYSPSRYRYLRARVGPDPALEADNPGPVQMRVLHTIRIAALEQEWPAGLGARLPGRESTSGDYASTWDVRLPGGESVPWHRLEFEAEEAEFSRRWQLEEVIDKPESSRVIVTGEWNRVAGSRQPLVIVLDSEVTARRLRFVMVDQRNAPLTLKLVKATAAAVQIIFDHPTVEGPLKLYFGNPDAPDPGYDYARALPNDLVPDPIRAQAGVVGPNPVYQAKPLPLTERSPALTYVVFGLVAAVLLAVLVLLARRAIAASDAAGRSPTAETASPGAHPAP